MGPYIRCVLGEGLAMEPVGASGGRQSGDGRTTTAARRPRDAALRRDKKKLSLYYAHWALEKKAINGSIEPTVKGLLRWSGWVLVSLFVFDDFAALLALLSSHFWWSLRESCLWWSSRLLIVLSNRLWRPPCSRRYCSIRLRRRSKTSLCLGDSRSPMLPCNCTMALIWTTQAREYGLW